ncbi:MAG: hypothetical protein WKF84_03110 [Pyrinomonadaceae bacterium]
MVATHAQPATDSAQISAMPKPSCSEGKTKTSQARNKSGMSLPYTKKVYVVNDAFGFYDALQMREPRLVISRADRQQLNMRKALLNLFDTARIAYSKPFCGEMRPTARSTALLAGRFNSPSSS